MQIINVNLPPLAGASYLEFPVAYAADPQLLQALVHAINNVLLAHSSITPTRRLRGDRELVWRPSLSKDFFTGFLFHSAIVRP